VLGLIIGGAIGNAIDRLAYGAVADFVLFHITTASLMVRVLPMWPLSLA
jgi:lipoprotein signal peptidase